MQNVSEIPIMDWLPDSPSFKNPGCEVADNVIPTPRGFGPLSGLVGQSDTVTGNVSGAELMFDNMNASLIVGGTDNRLFVRRSSGVTQTTGLSSIGAGEAWDFARFNNFVVATANANAPQYLTDIDSDNTWSALPGSPPNAKRCAKVGEFLMLGCLPAAPNRIQWSSYNNPAGSWAASRLTQAGQADLDANFGSVQRIVGGRFGLIFQDRGIQRLTYVGPPIVWRADPIVRDHGVIAPFSVVNNGYFVYYLSQDGFRVTNGSSDQSISRSRVNEWFFDNVDQSTINEVHGAIDWQNQLIVWAFKSNSTSFNRLIIYSMSLNRWTTASVTTGWVVDTTLDGIDIDSLDAIYGNLDSISLSLDSNEFRPKNRRLAAWVNGATTAEYSTFTGDNLEAFWETGEFQAAPQQRVFVDEVKPDIDADTWDMRVQLIGKDNRNAQLTSGLKQCGWSGFAPVRLEAEKMALQITKPSGAWKDMQGAQVRFDPAGYR